MTPAKTENNQDLGTWIADLKSQLAAVKAENERLREAIQTAQAHLRAKYIISGGDERKQVADYLRAALNPGGSE